MKELDPIDRPEVFDEGAWEALNPGERVRTLRYAEDQVALPAGSDPRDSISSSDPPAPIAVITPTSTAESPSITLIAPTSAGTSPSITLIAPSSSAQPLRSP